MSRTPPRGDAGFTMATVMLAMLVVMSLSVAAFAAANGDIRLGQRNVDSKRAYGAAEAGVAYYVQKLGQDNDYWTRCTNDPSAPQPNPVGQVAGSTPAEPRGWRALPTDATAQYTIELLPANGKPKCVENDNESMIDPAQGTLRIRSTGRTNGVYRSVVASLRRNGFLDFIYFSDFETSDPAQQILAQPDFPFDGKQHFWRQVGLKRVKQDLARRDTAGVYNDSVEAWASSTVPGPRSTMQPTCGQWLRATPDTDGRARTRTYPGSAYFDPDGGGSAPRDWYDTTSFGDYNVKCSRIQFGDNDEIKGPFHSNDNICVSSGASFGRDGKGDRIEFYGFDDACDNSADFKSDPTTGVDMQILKLPETNGRLKESALGPYIFYGKTSFQLAGTNMTVTRSNGQVSTMPLPANGLIYVDKHPTDQCIPFNPDDPTPAVGDVGCGDAYVEGTYAKGLTIAARRDVVVTQDVTAAAGSDALLGLIAENFVRVGHKVASTVCDTDVADAPGQDQDRFIQAAMLSLNHVFTVDNYHCGGPLGKLTVKGAVGQRFRGPVGTPGSAPTGYLKDYQYDDRLKFRSPPYFITPAQSAWRVLRSTEQAPATQP